MTGFEEFVFIQSSASTWRPSTRGMLQNMPPFPPDPATAVAVRASVACTRARVCERGGAAQSANAFAQEKKVETVRALKPLSAAPKNTRASRW